MLWLLRNSLSRRGHCGRCRWRRAPGRFGGRRFARLILMVDVERRGWWWKGEARAVERGGRATWHEAKRHQGALLMQYLNIERKQKPWCEEGVSWSRGERLKVEGRQSRGGLKDETLRSKRWTFSRITSRDRVSLNTVLCLRAGGWTGGTSYVFWLLLWLRFLHKTGTTFFKNHNISLFYFRLLRHILLMSKAYLEDSRLDIILLSFYIFKREYYTIRITDKRI